ncbi:hypothetical protein BESB_037080 [Besnoitia besnoiti]|uniref:C3H1-type domain-containing protein n=1 Tax=Besnoitia besnoiti TaxID=94643 RepID=A0A2A9MNH8_BESBE|nr:hypothetical protein BESB_037080 [Besnoitia besnoiti]PFH37250.1 hypothetical protein BESB_037080 [Besnoitia besnoiti]
MLGSQPSAPPSSSEKSCKRTGPELNARLSKTRLCRFVTSGRMCPFGSSCTYAHSDAELVPSPNLAKTKVCWSNMYGRCARGSECPYAHNEEELRRLPRLAIPLKSGAPLPPSSPYVVYYSEDNPTVRPALLHEQRTARGPAPAARSPEIMWPKGSAGANVEYVSWTSDDDTISGSASTRSSHQRQNSAGSRQDNSEIDSATQSTGHGFGGAALCSSVSSAPLGCSAVGDVPEASQAGGLDEAAGQQTHPWGAFSAPYIPAGRLPLSHEGQRPVQSKQMPLLSHTREYGVATSGSGLQHSPQADGLLDDQRAVHYSIHDWLLDESGIHPDGTRLVSCAPSAGGHGMALREPLDAYPFVPTVQREKGASLLGRQPWPLKTPGSADQKAAVTADFESTRQVSNPIVRWTDSLPDLRGDWLDRIKLHDCVSIR